MQNTFDPITENTNNQTFLQRNATTINGVVIFFLMLILLIPVAMIEEDAWPNAQALTSWPKSLTKPSFIVTSTVTLEPHSFEWATAVASGFCNLCSLGMSAAKPRIFRL